MVKIENKNCLDLLNVWPVADCVITDPPYPNNAGHFLEGIKDAEEFIKKYPANHWFIFWDEMSRPPLNLPLVAVHIWHRTNTNRPDNYEAILEYNANGIKRPSRVFPAPVIYPGLTGCVEATGHPTQKPVKLIRKIISINKITGLIADPFMGSGTTAIACIKEKNAFIGAETKIEYYEQAKKRIEQETAKQTLF